MNEYEIFVKAAEIDPNDVDTFLNEACADGPEIRSRVIALLHAHRGSGFLDNYDSSPHEWETPRIDDYKILEHIGEGAFGDVYMAEQQAPIRRRVAIKVIKLGMDTKQVVARFDAERQATAMMDHPSIASIYGAGATDNGRPYFAMELVRGESITNYCDNQRLGTRDRLELIASVCRAIQHAHQKGVIHRDIKSSNVMVTIQDGKALPKVIDFGIAKATDQPLTDKTLFTQFRQMVGTPAYMSPEQTELNASDVDTRSDIYSIGVLLYEVLAGKTPLEFNESKYDDMLRTIRETDPPTLAARLVSLDESERSTIAERRRVVPTELVRIVDGELNWIVAKALSKDRTQRYDTAAAFADDIERFLKDQPVVASPPSATYKFAKFIRRNRLLVTSMSAVLMALVVGLAVAIAGLSEARDKAEIARIEGEKAIQQAAIAGVERENAIAQADRAETIFKMLRDLLLTADPDEGHGPNYTVRESLHAFANSLPSRLDGTMPDVEAEINSIIGNTYDRLTMRFDAKKYLKRAAELRQTATPIDYARLVEAYTDFAENALKRCDAREARQAAEMTIQTCEKGGFEVPKNINDILVQADELLNIQDLIVEESDKFRHRDVVPQLDDLLDNRPDSLTGTLFGRIVFLLLDVGEYEKAIEVCLNQRWAFDLKHHDQQRNVRANVNAMLVLIYREHGSPDLAHELYASLREDSDGDANWFRNNKSQQMILADAILNDGNCAREERERAALLAKDFALFVRENMERVVPHAVAIAFQTYGLALAQTDDFDGAADALETALSNTPDRLLFIRGMLERQLADVYEKAGQPKDAEAILRKGMQWRKECLPENYIQRSVAEMNLAMYLLRVGSDASALEAKDLLDSAYHRAENPRIGGYYRTAIKEALTHVTAE